MRYLKVILGSVFLVYFNAVFAGFSVEAGPIWNGEDAQGKCPNVCGGKDSTWTGQWWTTVPNKMSVCQCEYKPFSVEAGPIWNGQDAQSKCPNVCGGKNSAWTGQWWTTVPNEMSVCQCLRQE